MINNLSKTSVRKKRPRWIRWSRWFSWTRYSAVANKEFLHMRRDRLTLGIMFGIPVVQLTLFGFAINTNVDHIPLVVADLSHSSQAREVVEKMVATSYFDLVEYVPDYQSARDAIDHEKAKAALLFPPNFASDLKRGSAQVGALVDASDPLLASSALSTAAQVGQVMNFAIVNSSANTTLNSGTPAIDIRTQSLYNPDLRSAVYIVPGLIGVILTMTMVLVTAVAIVRERESGALEALITTPVSKLELMVGKITPYVMVGFVQMTLVLLLANIVFGIAIKGSLPLIYAVGLLFIIASLGVGMLVSTVCKTQIQAMQLSFFFFLPNILLSGFMFPISAMPWIIQKIAHLLPLTYFLVFLRGALLKGTGFNELFQFIWPLAVFAPIIVTLGILRFSKKLN